MATEVLNLTSGDDYWNSLRRGAEVLRSGGLVALPTETVYGIAACAEIPEAVHRLRELKGRESDQALTVHVGRRALANEFLAEVPRLGAHLMRNGWPGPLTLVFDVEEPEQTPIGKGKDAAFLSCVYYGNSVGLRYPDFAATCELIEETGRVVVASSANPKGQTPPTRAEQVLDIWDGQLDLLLDGGTCQYGAPSTIVKVLDRDISILREGVYSERTIRKLAQTKILILCSGNTCRSPMATGMLKDMLAKKLECPVEELEQLGFRVESAGTFAVDGAVPTPEAVAAMSDMGVDISGHGSRCLTREMVQEADLILVMTESHRSAVLDLDPAAVQRTQRLIPDLDIEDPVGGSASTYIHCRNQIAAGLKQHIAEILP